jgi:predicted exporter
MLSGVSDIVGKPVLVDELKPELGARLVKLIVEDNERALRARDKKRKQRKNKARR